MRVGRKRKSGAKRFPNGQTVPVKDANTRALAQLQPHRRLVPQDVAHDPRAESIMGRLCLNGWLSQDQYEAGVKYRDIVMRYRAVIDAPRGEVSMSGVIVGPWGGGFTLDDAEVDRRRSDYMAAYEALEGGSGHAGARAVASCAVYERREFTIAHVRKGLSALAAHFTGLTRGKKAASSINRR